MFCLLPRELICQALPCLFCCQLPGEFLGSPLTCLFRCLLPRELICHALTRLFCCLLPRELICRTLPCLFHCLLSRELICYALPRLFCCLLSRELICRTLSRLFCCLLPREVVGRALSRLLCLLFRQRFGFTPRSQFLCRLLLCKLLRTFTRDQLRVPPRRVFLFPTCDRELLGVLPLGLSLPGLRFRASTLRRGLPPRLLVLDLSLGLNFGQLARLLLGLALLFDTQPCLLRQPPLLIVSLNLFCRIALLRRCNWLRRCAIDDGRCNRRRGRLIPGKRLFHFCDRRPLPVLCPVLHRNGIGALFQSRRYFRQRHRERRFHRMLLDDHPFVQANVPIRNRTHTPGGARPARRRWQNRMPSRCYQMKSIRRRNCRHRERLRYCRLRISLRRGRRQHGHQHRLRRSGQLQHQPQRSQATAHRRHPKLQ